MMTFRYTPIRAASSVPKLRRCPGDPSRAERARAPMTGDLAAFLAARLDEDEAIARHAGSCDFYDDVDDSVPLADERNHILRHAPARVLREVAAKRAILDQSEVEVEYGRQ